MTTDKLREALQECADVIEKLAFSMPAPNSYTPVFVQLCNSIRQAAAQPLIQAHSKSEYKRLSAMGADVVPPPSDEGTELPGMWGKSDLSVGETDCDLAKPAATDGFVRVPLDRLHQMRETLDRLSYYCRRDEMASILDELIGYRAAAPQSGKKEDGLQYPEGCTPTDIAVLRKANIDLANESRRYQSILEEVQQLFGIWEGGLDEMDGEEYTKACEEWGRVEKLVNDTLPPAPSSIPSKAEDKS